ncbi:CAAX protease self-immunity [Leptospira inadai serovar Lyme str. 10]|uniref:CAAX protease self-immunity n=2 Tax=Leptospira inadai serovar Lyme TaxID=293084 RepID=V6HCX7_9LEPT|nr:type II CAAX endopeptidase family protein [Leptospira inadai]EQA37597.1 CAAX protease self-immunity [Leptospira inadai serovar Lyme str. 10]PNV74696.1 CPBP family intramembrane metalloprotease [Leptospira inadai serovar Lyme]
MTDYRSFPGLPGSILIVLATIITTFIVGFLFNQIDHASGIGLTETELLGITNTVSIGFVTIMGWYFTGRRFSEVFSLQKPKLLESLSIVLTCIGFTILISEIDNVFSLLVPKPDFILDMLNRLFSDNDLVGTAIALMIVAPFTEEFLFRGLIFDGLKRNYSFRTAALLTALLFGILHLNPWQFLGASVVGYYFAWLVAKTGSVAQPILAHMVFNGFPILVKHGFQIKIEGYTGESMANGLLQPIWLDILGIVIMVFGMLISITLFRQRSKLSED